MNPTNMCRLPVSGAGDFVWRGPHTPRKQGVSKCIQTVLAQCIEAAKLVMNVNLQVLQILVVQKGLDSMTQCHDREPEDVRVHGVVCGPLSCQNYPRQVPSYCSGQPHAQVCFRAPCGPKRCNMRTCLM
eukprot:1029168-Amphidinium_carterae.2